MIVDIVSSGLCGGGAMNVHAPTSWENPSWASNTTSNRWTWSTANDPRLRDVPPVYIEAFNYIQTVVVADVYKNGTKVKDDLRTTISPEGL